MYTLQSITIRINTRFPRIISVFKTRLVNHKISHCIRRVHLKYASHLVSEDHEELKILLKERKTLTLNFIKYFYNYRHRVEP